MPIDISDRKQAENALKESELRFQHALDAGEFGIWSLNAATGERWHSLRFDQIFGYREHQTLWNHEIFLEHVLPEDREEVDRSFQYAISTGTEWDTACRIRRKDGTLRWIWVQGSPHVTDCYKVVQMVGLLRDITARKEMDENRRKNWELLHSVIEGTSDAIYVKDIEGCYLLFNTAATRLAGVAAEEAIGKDDTFLFRPEVAKAVMEGDLAVMASGKTQTYEEVVIDARGKRLIFLSTKGPLFDGRGNVTGLFSIGRDVTERKQLEEILKEQQEGLYQLNERLEQKVVERTKELAAVIDKLKQTFAERLSAEQALKEETADRLHVVEELRENERLMIKQSRQAAMGEMIGNIAHQWRQPLNTLGLTIQNLSLAYETGEFSKELLDTSTSDAMKLILHMSKTIDDFRNFFKPNKEKIVFSIDGAIDQTLSLVEASFKSQRIIVSMDFSGELEIHGYPNEFSQVILNLLLNARDVLLERSVAEPGVWIQTFMEREKNVVIISDNAGGIKDEVLDKIFEPYFTTKGPDKGTGIGLFMSKVIIEQNMGGRLTAYNNEYGAEFRIEI